MPLIILRKRIYQSEHWTKLIIIKINYIMIKIMTLINTNKVNLPELVLQLELAVVRLVSSMR